MVLTAVVVTSGRHIDVARPDFLGVSDVFIPDARRVFHVAVGSLWSYRSNLDARRGVNISVGGIATLGRAPRWTLPFRRDRTIFGGFGRGLNDDGLIDLIASSDLGRMAALRNLRRART